MNHPRHAWHPRATEPDTEPEPENAEQEQSDRELRRLERGISEAEMRAEDRENPPED